MDREGKPRLYVGLELSTKKWGMAFSNEDRIREVVVAARDQSGVAAWEVSLLLPIVFV